MTFQPSSFRDDDDALREQVLADRLAALARVRRAQKRGRAG